MPGRAPAATPPTRGSTRAAVRRSSRPSIAPSCFAGMRGSGFGCSRANPCRPSSPRRPTGRCANYETDGQIGRDDSLSDYVNSIVGAFEEVKRVLRDDGTVWLNVGDAFTSGNRRYRAPDRKNRARAMSVRPPTPEGLKPKDLIGLPWRLAFALQDAGWWLRLGSDLAQAERAPGVGARPPHEGARDAVPAVEEPELPLRRPRGAGTERAQAPDRLGHPDRAGAVPQTATQRIIRRRCRCRSPGAASCSPAPRTASCSTRTPARGRRCWRRGISAGRWVGIELNPAFVDLIAHRMGADEPG